MNPQSLNKYSYVFNNPLKYNDPTGNWPNWGKLLHNVGQFCAGVGEGIVNTVTATVQMVVNPVQTVQAIGYAVTHPVETFNAIKNQLATEAGSARGIGNIVGQVIGTVAIGYATAGIGSAVAGGIEALATVVGGSGIVTNAINTLAATTRILTGASTAGAYDVYRGVSITTGEVKYIGMTSQGVEVRAAQHFATDPAKASLTFERIRSLSGLSYNEARVQEQILINQYGLARNGGQLINRINSIAPKYWGLFGIK
jgi:hypothetical protein